MSNACGKRKDEPVWRSGRDDSGRAFIPKRHSMGAPWPLGLLLSSWRKWEFGPRGGILSHYGGLRLRHSFLWLVFQVVLSRQYGSEGRFTFTSHTPGEHQICLHSNSSRMALFAGGKLVSQFTASLCCSLSTLLLRNGAFVCPDKQI